MTKYHVNLRKPGECNIRRQVLTLDGVRHVSHTCVVTSAEESRGSLARRTMAEFGAKVAVVHQDGASKLGIDLQ